MLSEHNSRLVSFSFDIVLKKKNIYIYIYIYILDSLKDIQITVSIYQTEILIYISNKVHEKCGGQGIIYIKQRASVSYYNR